MAPDSVRRAELPGNSPAAVAPCIPRARSQAADLRARVPAWAHALALVSGRALVRVPVDQDVPEALRDSYHLRVRLRGRSVPAVRHAVAVRPTRRAKKAR